jgi:hypothetical protein
MAVGKKGVAPFFLFPSQKNQKSKIHTTELAPVLFNYVYISLSMFRVKKMAI